MKQLLFISLLCFGISHANEPQQEQEWEALDLEETHMQEMEEQHREEFEDREGDLQIQAEEEEILPLESEDSRNFNPENQPKED